MSINRREIVKMEFSPSNAIIKFCVQGMGIEEKGKPEEAGRLFLKAWNEATDDFEKYIAAYFVARHQKRVADRVQWLETALQFALKMDDEAVRSALPSLYSGIARCCEESGDIDKAIKNQASADSISREPSDKGPFYHGTRADLQIGDMLTAGSRSNYNSGVVMNHVYFTALINGAGLAAALAKGEGRERVYIVEPTGGFENDPNVTDKKFPGNPTRSYRTRAPLKIVGEVTSWVKQTPGELKNWRVRLDNVKGDIIN